MLDLARVLDLTWWLNHIEKKQQRRTMLAFEELEDRCVPTLLGQQLFPADYPWNQNIANAPVAANSAAVISHIGSSIGIHPDWGEDSAANGSDPLYGIPINVVHGNTATKINVIIDNYPGESDIISVPMPSSVVIEGDYQNGPNNNGGGYGASQRGDSHLIVWDEDNNIAYELYGVTRPADPKLFPNTDGVEVAHTDGLWHAAQESVWDMSSNSFRTLGATSADAAGLSILAGLARPDEGLPVAEGGQGAISHAIRFTLPSGDVTNQYIYPASHQVSGSVSSTKLPFGSRLRLANTPAVNAKIAQMGPEAQIIAHAMQQYGLVLADIGSAMYITGTSAAKTASNGISLTWNMDDVLGLNALKAGDFDVVDLTPVVTGLSASSGAPGSTITITGKNFSGSAGNLSVFFGSVQSSQVTYISDTQITAVVPAGSGSVDVTVQSGVVETDDISDNPNANAKGAIFGYGTSATSSADLFTLSGGGAQTVSGSNSNDSFASSSIVNGATDVLTIVVKDTTGAGFTGLDSSAFAFSLAGGTSAGSFGAVTETATPGTYSVTFTGTTIGTQSTLTVKVNGVTISHHPGITVTAPAFAVLGPNGAIAAATGYDRPTFTWNSFTGADHYMLVVTDKTTNTTAFTVANVAGTSYATTVVQALTPGHTYVTTVSAMSAANVKLGSATQTFSLAALAAPTSLTPSGTRAAASGFDRPTFTWHSVAGADHYTLMVTDNTAKAQAFSVSNITGTSYATTAGQALTPGHSFMFTLTAYSTNNKVSTNATQTFTLAALTAPTGLSPSGTVAASAGFDRPTFAWTAVAGADHYYLLVTDSTMSAKAFAVSNIVGTSYTTTAAQALTPGHRFTFALYAYSTNNKASGMAMQTFTLAALTAPTGLSPSGAIAAAAGFDRPTFAWNAVAGADHYYLSVVDNTTNTTAFTVSGIAGTSYTATAAQALTPGHRFTVNVYADSTNNKASAKAMQTITLAALTVPTGLSPGGTIAASAGFDQPTIGWNAVAGADHYYLLVADSTLNAKAFAISGITGTSYTATAAQALTPGHKYTITLYAYSTNSKASAKVMQTFTLAAYPATTLNGPVGAIVSTMPTFAWSAVAGADHFVLSVVDNTTGATAINTTVAGTSFTPSTPFVSGHRYTWRVSAVSTNGKFAPWSVSQIFTIS